MPMLALAAAIGLGVGVVVGALGAGGGILTVPVLVYLLGQDAHAATASSLVIVLLTALVSIIHHARRRTVQWRDGLIFAALSVLGAVLGSRLSALVPSAVIMTLFGALLAVVALAMLRHGLRVRAREVLPDIAVPPAPARGLLALPAAATATGALTGFFGVGGGFIVVPMLVMALGLPMRRAAGTSLLVMIVATAVSLLARIGTPVHIDWALTLALAAGAMVGGLLGGPLSARARASTLTLLFAGLLGAVAALTLVESLLIAA